MSRSKLTRNQLAKFLPNPEAIKAFEELLADVGMKIPTDLEGLSAEASNAAAAAGSALAALAEVAQGLAMVLLAPARVDVMEDHYTPPSPLDTTDALADFERRLAALESAPVAGTSGVDPFPMQYPTRNPRGNGSWSDLWVPDQHTFVDNVLSLRNQSRDAGGTIYGLAAICCLDGGGTERGAFGYSRNSAIQPAGYTPDIVYVEFGDPFSGDANPSSFQLICTMAAGSAWFPGTTFVAMEHVTKTGATVLRARGGQPISLAGGYTLTEDLSVGYKGNVKQALGGMTNTAWRIRERDNIDSAAWTTNIDNAGTQDDATKPSWKIKHGYGNGDDSFKVERAPAGSSSFTELLKVASNGNVQLNTQAGNTLIGRTATSTFGSNGILQLRENTNEFILGLKNAGSKEWVWGVNANTLYLRNVTDSVTALQVANGGRLLVGAPTDDGATRLQVNGGIKHSDTTLLCTSVALTNGAAAAAGTLTNAPVAGNPTKWIPINDNGTVRYIPAW